MDENSYSSTGILVKVLVVLCVVNLVAFGWLAFREYRTPPPPGRQLAPPPQPMEPHARGRGMGMGNKHRQMMTDWVDRDKMRDIYNILGQYYPEVKTWAEQRGPKARRWFRQTIWKRWPRVMALVEAHRKDPELAEKMVENDKLDKQADAMSREYQYASREQKKAIRKKLFELLSRQFEVRQWIRQRRLEDLEKQLAKLRTELDQRLKKRNELIEYQLKRKLRKPSETRDW